jgi:GNAT superfamily N-acetyltransferase
MGDRASITFRLLTEADLDAAAYVRKAALEALVREDGREPEPWMPRNPIIQRHLLKTDPEGSWVAEMDGVLVGYAQGFVRGELWYLAQLFVQPEVHAAGIGRGVLQRSQDYGKARGARIFAVSSSTSRAAQALYMRHGMFANAINYHLRGPVEPLLRLPEPEASKKRVVDCSGWQDRMADVDVEVWGAERRPEHQLFLSGVFGGDEGSFALTDGGNLLGYGYAIEDFGGFIGPIAARETGDQLPLLRMGASWLREHEVSDAGAYCSSTNHAMMSAFLDAGWKIDHWTFLLASESFGRFDRYLPSGGMLL